MHHLAGDLAADLMPLSISTYVSGCGLRLGLLLDTNLSRSREVGPSLLHSIIFGGF